MNKVMNIGMLMIILVMLTACGSNDAAVAESEVQEVAQSETSDMEEADNEDGETSREQLRADFAESALPPASQLILGTFMLEGTEFAVDAELAPYLVPYWKLYRSLLESDTTAPEEMAALVDEIQEVMYADQVNHIASLELTQEDLMTYMNESGIMESLRPEGVEEGDDTRPGRPDGMPEGTGPGGGQGGQGGGMDGMDPEVMATMQAEREAAGGGLRSNNRMIVPLIDALIELLESKAG